ncbi:MAG TPA: ribbon-helix-helix protein, CopG family [Gemmatimonadaceae bacterium]
MKYDHDKQKRPPRLAEPVQVYLQPSDRERLDRLTNRLGTTKSDVLRRSLEALDAQTAGAASGSGERVALPTFTGNGLLPGVDLDDTAALLHLMEE